MTSSIPQVGEAEHATAIHGSDHETNDLVLPPNGHPRDTDGLVPGANGTSKNLDPPLTSVFPRWLALVFGIICLLIICVNVIDLYGLLCDTCGFQLMPLNDNWRDFLSSVFGLGFSSVSLFFAIRIYSYQTRDSKRQEMILAELKEASNGQEQILGELKEASTGQVQILGKIDTLMSDYSPFKVSGVNAAELFLNWLDSDPQPNNYIFYFPYTVIPGFWNDVGATFETTVLKRLEEEPNSENKYVFIGSDANNSPFSMILDQMEQSWGSSSRDSLIDSFKRNKVFWNTLGMGSLQPPGDLEFHEIKDRILKSYSRKLDRLLELSRIKTYIRPHLLGKDSTIKTWASLPSCSFIIKASKDIENEAIYIDTFNFLSRDLKGIFHESKIDSVKRNGNPEGLLRPPRQYHIKSRKTTNLFISNLIECCFNRSNVLKSLVSLE